MQNLTNFQNFLNKPIKENKQTYSKIKKKIFFKNEKFKSFSRVTESFDKNTLIKEGGKRVKGYYKYSLRNKPLITVVTVVLNNDKDLEKTIKSVLFQKYQNIEYIIIDGGSNGSVITKIKKYEKFLDYWISQKDKGIFDAFNKGIRLANGEYICFLNVGDYFTEKATFYISKKIKIKKNLDVVFGSVKKKKIHAGFNEKNIKKSLNIFPSLMSSFINIKLFKKYGLFDLTYNLYNDYEFIYRIIKNKKLTYLTTNKNQVITIFDLYGVSSKINIFKRLWEEFKIRKKYENTIIVFIKLSLKFFRYYYLRLIDPKKFEKYN